MTITLTTADWDRLRRLRAGFLEAEARFEPLATEDYFRSRRDLEIYDATFAKRIEWKWAAALRELERRTPDFAPTSMADWGCGTGAATRAVLASSLGAKIRSVRLSDRSTRAMDYARKSLFAEFGDVDIQIGEPTAAAPVDLLVTSHVLDELDVAGEARLRELTGHASALALVESGSRATSHRLGQLREFLLADFEPVAPCTHSATCGALASDTYWCHLFARAPAEAFTDAFWRTFSDEMSIDLRSLAYSFLALVRRTDTPLSRCQADVRILGRPRVLKGRAMVDACSHDGVDTWSILERTDKALFKSLDQASNEPRVWRVEVAEKRIQNVEPL